MATISVRTAPRARMARAIEAPCGGLAGIIGALFVLHEHGAVASVGGCRPGDPGQAVICVTGIARVTSTAADPFHSTTVAALSVGLFLAIGASALWHSRTVATPAQAVLCLATGVVGLLGAYAMPAYGYGYVPGVALAFGACAASWIVQRSSHNASRPTPRDAGVT